MYFIVEYFILKKEDAIGMKQEIRMLNEEMETMKKETLENKVNNNYNNTI